MDDYVQESFVELMQRGIEIDVQPSNDVRVLWLAQDRSALHLGLNKRSIARQEITLSTIRVIRDAEDYANRCIEIATDDFSILFNVDTEISRDILVRNLIRVVDTYKKLPVTEFLQSDKSTNQQILLSIAAFILAVAAMVMTFGFAKVFLMGTVGLVTFSIVAGFWFTLGKGKTVSPTKAPKVKVYPIIPPEKKVGLSSIHPTTVQACAP